MRYLLAGILFTTLLPAYEEPPFRATKPSSVAGPIIVDTDAGR